MLGIIATNPLHVQGQDGIIRLSNKDGPAGAGNTPEPGQPNEEAVVQKSSASRVPVDPKTRLAKLEEKCRCEFMGEDERLEVYERIVRLRRKLGL
jgi:hypothetical protein